MAEQAQEFVELALHGDHLLAHMEDYFGTLQIHPHFFNEQAGHANTIDLIEGVEFLTLPDGGPDQALALQLIDELLIDAADFNDLGNSQIFTRHRSDSPL